MYRFMHISVLVTTLVLPSLATGQSFEEGLNAYQESNYATALENLVPLAQQGNPSAQHYLSKMYLGGRGVSKDINEASQWNRRAAEGGHADAQYALGLNYKFGMFELQNDNEATKWFELAATQGHKDAQFDLGLMYSDGRGVIQNDLKAVNWYRQAAEQGHGQAQNNLGLMYATGRGVSQNPVIAYILWSLAAAQSIGEAQRNRDSILEHLSREQINEGQRIATEWHVGMPIPTSKDVTTWQ